MSSNFPIENQDATEDIISLTPLTSFLKNRSHTSVGITSDYYKHILQRLEWEYPQKIISHAIPFLNGRLFELVNLLVIPGTQECEYAGALSAPLTNTIFYSTPAFRKIIGNLEERKTSAAVELLYEMILQKFYFISLPRRALRIFHKDSTTQLESVFALELNGQFIRILNKQKLPELSLQGIEDQVSAPLLEQIMEVIPLSLFAIEGFTLLTLRDITLEYAMQELQLNLTAGSCLSSTTEQNFNKLLQSITRNKDVSFNLAPIFKLNGKAMLTAGKDYPSVLFNPANSGIMPVEDMKRLVDGYWANPKVIIYNRSRVTFEKYKPIYGLLNKTKLKSYALNPVFYNNEIVGVVELYSEKDVSFDAHLLARLRQAMPVISQLLKHHTDKFTLEIEAIIRARFTSLQPAVQWKFNECAWQIMTQAPENVQPIEFKTVFPFYAAVDIRNSSINRNEAIEKDIETWIHAFRILFTKMKSKLGSAVFHAIPIDLQDFDEQIRQYHQTKNHITIEKYFRDTVHQHLSAMVEMHPVVQNDTDAYFKELDEYNGTIHTHKRNLEVSMRQITHTLNRFFELEHERLLKEYPFYFEKFRTDGVEYDLYMGQSIAPQVPFDEHNLANIRDWQVRSMCNVTTAMRKLQKELPVPLQTTQLIFVHPTPIDICFRNDEKRFDVEGGYNIRYQMIKKRIDKVRIKDSPERLTQPEMIAIAYLQDEDCQEYEQSIRKLQHAGLLQDNLEFLELEDLQGLTRLKALRVGVV